jgi:hypothetical protein
MLMATAVVGAGPPVLLPWVLLPEGVVTVAFALIFACSSVGANSMIFNSSTDVSLDVIVRIVG